MAVLGADTTVTLDNTILGKPEDAADAARMLRLLSGRTHRVITGVAVVTADGAEVAAETTAVVFLAPSDAEIAEYVASGEPMDKAGAYAIQGRAARWIPRIEGCYFNVVGLPITLVSAAGVLWRSLLNCYETFTNRFGFPFFTNGVTASWLMNSRGLYGFLPEGYSLQIWIAWRSKIAVLEEFGSRFNENPIEGQQSKSRV